MAREVRRYALPRLPPHEPPLALATAGRVAAEEERKDWGIIEID